MRTDCTGCTKCGLTDSACGSADCTDCERNDCGNTFIFCLTIFLLFFRIICFILLFYLNLFFSSSSLDLCVWLWGHVTLTYMQEM